MTNKAKVKARRIQEITGMSYTTCLSLAHGDIGFTPVKEGCLVSKAVKEVRPNSTMPAGRPCRCSVCAPEK